jgi:hypothetical protein
MQNTKAGTIGFPFSHLAGIKHLSIWKLLTKKRQEVGTNKARIELADVGEINWKKTKTGIKC